MASLTPPVAQSFQIGRSFATNTHAVNAISFSASGEQLVTSSDDDSINLYDCRAGKHKRPLYSKKYGCSLVTFTHSENTVLHCSTKGDDRIRYLSLHDNKYIRYYSAHKAQVTSISLSPVEDTFLSCSKDKTIRLWDIRVANCAGSMPTSTPFSAAAFDPQGRVFATGADKCLIRLYDTRQYEQGPFLQPVLHAGVSPQDQVLDIQFSGDGMSMLVLTSSGVVHLMDAYTGEVKHRLGENDGPGLPDSRIPSGGDVVSACFSPCGQYLYGGTNEGRIQVWDVKHGVQVASLTGHMDAVNVVKFNTKYLMFASACKSLAMWLPTITS
eukprot:m.332641 g.332641  ORF g.332641 m.332641 type:complete len:326 (-) comp16977_c0_seq1:47-1024(-)